MTDQALQRARGELEAVAALIERPPLDDVQLEQDAALRLSRAIRTVLATPVTVTEAEVRAAYQEAGYSPSGACADEAVFILRERHLIGDGSGWARRITEAEWDAQIGHPTEDIAFYWTEKARQAARTLGFIAPDPDPLSAVKAVHPDINPAVVESIAKMVGRKAS